MLAETLVAGVGDEVVVLDPHPAEARLVGGLRRGDIPARQDVGAVRGLGSGLPGGPGRCRGRRGAVKKGRLAAST